MSVDSEQSEPNDSQAAAMNSPLRFEAYQPSHRQACLALFDANTPAFFAPNEREEYLDFLDAAPAHYEVCRVGEELVGAFGLVPGDTRECHLRWIMLAPQAQGQGIGSATMARAAQLAMKHRCPLVRIAASHKSAPFFARFGARATETIPDGWGPGMHRVNMEWRPE